MPWMRIFSKNNQKDVFDIPLGICHIAKFKKKLLEGSQEHELKEHSDPFAPNNIFFLIKTNNITLNYIPACFILQN